MTKTKNRRTRLGAAVLLPASPIKRLTGPMEAANYMETFEKKKAGRPVLTPAELLEKAQILREHLEQPADSTRPHLGTTYQLVKIPLAQQLPTPARLGAWWRRERVQLTYEEIELCWRWLLPQ